MKSIHEHPEHRGHEEHDPHDHDEHRHAHRHGGFGGRRGGPREGRAKFRRGGPFGGFGGFGPEGFGPGQRHGGPHGPRGPEGRGGRRGRRSRGDVRTAVLALLAEQPMHGYQIIQEIGERSGGAWRPSPGSVYPTVSQLADEGLVRTEKSDGRSVVHLTEDGERHVAEHREELDAVWSTAAGEDGFAALRTAGRGLAGAVRQVAEVGSTEQVADAVRLLDETRKRLYLLLAGESAALREDLQAALDEDGPEDTDEDAG